MSSACVAGGRSHTQHVIISLNPRDKPVRWLPLVFPFQRMRKLRSERDSPFAPGGRVGGRASPCC